MTDISIDKAQPSIRNIPAAISALEDRFGADFSTNQSHREQHSHTQTWIPSQLPDGVLFATDKTQVIEAVKICAKFSCPIIPFGIGSSLEGHVNAPEGGVSIDMTAMNQVVAIYPEDLMVTVQPGITREALNTELRDTGLFFPIDPGANATIGGMTATRASGTNAVRYGTMKDLVLSVEVVTPSGELIRTGTRAKKSSAGYDLTRLFVGSEGTLGVFTEITLKLFGRSEVMAGGVCGFPTLEDACNAVIMTIQSGIPVARIELMDELQVRGCNLYSQLEMKEQPTLFVEFHGSDANVTEQAQLFSEIASDNNGDEFVWSSDATEHQRLWKARHNAYFAAKALRPGADAIATDVCVPISRLAECVVATKADILEQGFIAPIVGHVGDGNFHVSLLIDKTDAIEVEAAEAFVARLSDLAISMEGTCTGEHGIGQGKPKFLVDELGGAVDIMKGIKQSIDPQNIMNPGKIFCS